MAKLKTGIGIASISGTSGSAVFATRRDGSVILRERPTPSGRTTPAQQEARRVFALASAAWRGLTLEEQTAWLQWARATDPFAGASGAANAFRSLAVRWYGVNGSEGGQASGVASRGSGFVPNDPRTGAPSSCAGDVLCPEHEEGVGGGASPESSARPTPPLNKDSSDHSDSGHGRAFFADSSSGAQANGPLLHPLTPSSCVRHEPSGPHEEGGLEDGPPRLPPNAPFGGDAVIVTASGTSTGVRYTSDRANATGVVTELLAARVVSALAAPRDRDYRVVGRYEFTTVGESVDVPLNRGRYAVAVRFVLASTGQATEVLRSGVVSIE